MVGLEPVHACRNHERHEHRRDDDPRADMLGEVGDRGWLCARREDEHRAHEAGDGDDCPCPADGDDGKRDEAGSRLDLAGLGERLVHRSLGWAAGVGSGERDTDHQSDQHRHQHIDQAPAHPRGQHQRERAADDRGDAIAELVNRREQLDWRLLVGNIDPPRIDRNVLGGGGEARDNRENCKPADVLCRVGQRERDKGGDHHRLAQHDPAFAATETVEQRDFEAVDQRRPEEFEGISQPDPRQDADRREVDLLLAEPGVEGADEERIGQARREAEAEHAA